MSCSIGDVPVGPWSFRGFLIGLKFGEEFYSFTSQEGARLQVEKEGCDLRVIARNRHHIIEIALHSAENSRILCRGPQKGEMIPLVEESLQGQAKVRLIERRSGKVLLDDTGRHAGLEYGGDAHQRF